MKILTLTVWSLFVLLPFTPAQAETEAELAKTLRKYEITFNNYQYIIEQMIQSHLTVNNQQSGSLKELSKDLIFKKLVLTAKEKCDKYKQTLVKYVKVAKEHEMEIISIYAENGDDIQPYLEYRETKAQLLRLNSEIKKLTAEIHALSEKEEDAYAELNIKIIAAEIERDSILQDPEFYRASQTLKRTLPKTNDELIILREVQGIEKIKYRSKRFKRIYNQQHRWLSSLFDFSE